MKNKIFRNKDIVEITGLTMRQIVNWTDKGLIVPVLEANGAGSKREYSFRNILEIAIIRELFEIGFGIWRVKKIMKEVRKSLSLEPDFVDKLSEFSSLKIDTEEIFVRLNF